MFDREKIDNNQFWGLYILMSTSLRERSGRVLNSRQKGGWFKPHQRHWVVALSKTRLSLLSTGSTQEDPS